MVELVQVEAWKQLPWLRHGFSTRAGGVSTVYGGEDLNLGFTRDDARSSVEWNRAALLEAVMPGGSLAIVHQVHGIEMRTVRTGGQAGEADGLVTASSGLLLGAQTADCVPVLLVDGRRRVVSAVHAGWRGTASGIVAEAVRRMREEFGSSPEDLQAAIGPSVGACCYQVGEEITARFRAVGRREGALYVDLWEENRRQLAEAGVRATVVAECTACTQVDGRRKYFSHRAEKGVTGRAMGVIGIVAE